MAGPDAAPRRAKAPVHRVTHAPQERFAAEGRRHAEEAARDRDEIAQLKSAHASLTIERNDAAASARAKQLHLTTLLADAHTALHSLSTLADTARRLAAP